ncbi:hypothetical protein ACFQ0B_80755 [Nonomuraea thailandensis]
MGTAHLTGQTSATSSPCAARRPERLGESHDFRRAFISELLNAVSPWPSPTPSSVYTPGHRCPLRPP